MATWIAAGVALLGVSRGEAQVVSGFLRDSLLTDGPLPNAVVWIEGVPKEARTDLYGRFQFDSLPPGQYTLSFNHPAFDAAGIAAPVFRIDVPPSGLQGVILATPSADALYGRSCPTPRRPGTGYLVGVVRDAGTDTALVGAVVNVIWAEVEVTRTTGLRTKRRSTRAETGPQGAFVVCNVPSNGEVTAWAVHRGVSTGLVTLQLEGRPLAARQFTIGTRPLATAASATDSAALAARLDGVVRNIDGEPIADARVFVRGSPSFARTTASGAFSLSGLPPGTQVVEVSALGYEPGRRAVDLKPGQAGRTELTLGKSVQVLQPLEAVGKLGAGADVSTFEDRARRGFGYFITQADIEQRGAVVFEDIMRGVPGMSVIPVGQGYRVMSNRGVPNMQGECQPAYFVDGAPFYVSLNGDAFPIAPQEILAMEVYAGTASVPAEFQRMQHAGCGVIAIWTKRGGAARPRPGTR